MKRYTIVLTAIALMAVLLPGCRRRRQEPVTMPTTMPTTAATTAPTTVPTTAPTTRPTETQTTPTDDTVLPGDETAGSDGTVQDDARRIMPKGIR